MERVCLNCGEKLTGRKDKKFCTDYCRSSYNYVVKSEDYAYIKRVNRILIKNHGILKENIQGDKARIKKAKLIEQGYNFSFHTNSYTNKKGLTYLYVYDYGYVDGEGEYTTIIKKPDYID